MMKGKKDPQSDDKQSRVSRMATCVGKIKSTDLDDTKTRECLAEGWEKALEKLEKLGYTKSSTGELVKHDL